MLTDPLCTSIKLPRPGYPTATAKDEIYRQVPGRGLSAMSAFEGIGATIPRTSEQRQREQTLCVGETEGMCRRGG